MICLRWYSNRHINFIYLLYIIRLCGDVTHFAKDCPQKQKRKREEDIATVGIMDDRSIEDLDDIQISRKQYIQNNTNIFKRKKPVIMK